MSKLNYPEAEKERLINMCKSIPKLKNKDLMNEPDRKVALLPSGKLSGTRPKVEMKPYNPEMEKGGVYTGYDPESHF